ncbi:hypothetical protein KM043_003059 [Ampulex compressa]|nr:hypothetical protein KM043_003059 [Ampulex compressa]
MPLRLGGKTPKPRGESAKMNRLWDFPENFATKAEEGERKGLEVGRGEARGRRHGGEKSVGRCSRSHSVRIKDGGNRDEASLPFYVEPFHDSKSRVSILSARRISLREGDATAYFEARLEASRPMQEGRSRVASTSKGDNPWLLEESDANVRKVESPKGGKVGADVRIAVGGRRESGRGEEAWEEFGGTKRKAGRKYGWPRPVIPGSGALE